MKKPLILLHGALGASGQFAPWLSGLEPDFDPYLLDFEGHGPRENSGGYFSIARFSENLADFVREKGLQGAGVFGYSMGGYVALHTALKQPGLIGDIFTFASKLRWDPETSAREVRMLDPDKIREKAPHFADALAARHTGIGWRTVLERTAEMMLSLGAAPALRAADYPGIHVRVRMGLGDQDNMVSLEETAEAARALPNGELLVLPGVKHPLERIPVPAILWQVRDFFNP